MKRPLILGAAGLAIALFLWNRPGVERYEVPVGYTGPVVVFFSHPNGVGPVHDWTWTHVYRIPATGVLLLKRKPPGAPQRQEWFYAAPDGTTTPILQEDGDETKQVPFTKEPRVRGARSESETTYGTGAHPKVDGEFTWIEAQIGRPADAGSFGKPPRDVVSRIVGALRPQR